MDRPILHNPGYSDTLLILTLLVDPNSVSGKRGCLYKNSNMAFKFGKNVAYKQPFMIAKQKLRDTCYCPWKIQVPLGSLINYDV